MSTDTSDSIEVTEISIDGAPAFEVYIPDRLTGWVHTEMEARGHTTVEDLLIDIISNAVDDDAT